MSETVTLTIEPSNQNVSELNENSAPLEIKCSNNDDHNISIKDENKDCVVTITHTEMSVVHPNNVPITTDLEKSNLKIAIDEDLSKRPFGGMKTDITVYMYSGGAGYPGAGQGYTGQGEPLAYEPTRNSFVRLVFTIVFIMLVATSIVIIFVLNSDLKQEFRRYGIFIMIPAMIFLIAMNYAVACCVCARRSPCSFVVLALTCIAMSLLASVTCARYTGDIVMYAFLATAGVVLICLLIACSSFDFTSYFIYIVVIAAAFFMVAMIISVTMFVMGVQWKPLRIVLLLVGTIINSAVLISELQMILGGRSIEIGEEDYSLAAYMLYTSILNLFMQLVQLLGLIDN